MGEAVSPAPGRGRVASLRLAGDDRLARRAAAGDTAAFAAIFRRYHRDLSRYLQAILGNREQTEDALQNTMVSALKSLPGETREIALKPWLYRVAHNEAISLLRQRRPHEELDPELPEIGADPHPRTETRDGLRTLLRDLETLPDRQRGALVMRELSDLSYAEIAASFDFSEGAARQAIYEARKALVEMAEGREMHCVRVREEISANDKRILRGRKLRAHLRACPDCREFEAAIKRRRLEFAQVAPLAPAAATAILQSVVGSTAAGAGAGGGALGAVGAGGALGGSALKTGAAVVAIAVAGAGAADLSGVIDLNGSGTREERSAASPNASETGAAASEAKGANGPAHAAEGSSAGGRGPHGSDAENGAGKGEGRNPGNQGGDGKGQGQGNGNAGGNGVGATGTPPGQAQTPPGQTLTPPGQASSSAAQNPNGAPPGQAATPPAPAQPPAGQAQTNTSPSTPAQAASGVEDRPNLLPSIP